MVATFASAAAIPMATSVIVGALTTPAGGKPPYNFGALSAEDHQLIETIGNQTITADEYAGITVIEEHETAVCKTLKWDNLLTLLQAAHHPRLCRSIDNARSLIKDGGPGDSCSMIGGFPFVVKTALPNLVDPFAKGKPDQTFNYQVAAVLNDHVTSPSLQTWAKVKTTLQSIAPKAADQTALCAGLYEGLVKFFEVAIRSNTATDGSSMIIVRGSKASIDRGTVYGPLGKVGNTTYRSSDVSKQIYRSPLGSAEPQKIAKMISGLVQMAERAAKDLK